MSADLIGQSFDRKRPVQDESRNRITVRGWNGRAYVCESAEEFGASFLLTAHELTTAYGVKAGVPESEDVVQARIAEQARQETEEGFRAQQRRRYAALVNSNGLG